jgi:hypothetical protein
MADRYTTIPFKERAADKQKKFKNNIMYILCHVISQENLQCSSQFRKLLSQNQITTPTKYSEILTVLQ